MTLGEVAYTEYRTLMETKSPWHRWKDLSPDQKDTWERVAEAVIHSKERLIYQCAGDLYQMLKACMESLDDSAAREAAEGLIAFIDTGKNP